MSVGGVYSACRSDTSPRRKRSTTHERLSPGGFDISTTTPATKPAPNIPAAPTSDQPATGTAAGHLPQVGPEGEVKPLDPTDGADYSWLVTRAKEAFREVDAAHDLLDTKAGSLLTHFGSAVGIASVITTAATAMEKLSPWVGGAAVVPFVAAVVALALAVRARFPLAVCAPPDAGKCLHFVGWRKTATGITAADAVRIAEYDTVSMWDRFRRMNLAGVVEKGDRLMAATWATVVAISLTVIPLAVAVIEKCATRPAE